MRFSNTFYRLVATGCMLIPFLCGAQETSANSDVSWISFQVPGAFETIPSGINDSMVVTGTYTYQGVGYPSGFIRSADGVLTTFSVPDSVATIPTAINGAGEIAGYSFSEGGRAYEGFVRKRDGTIDTFTPNAKELTYVTGINAHGTIIGYVTDRAANSPDYSFIRFADGEFIRFRIPWAAQTFPAGINDAGEVTGYYIAGPTYFGGFVRSCDGAIRTFHVPGYFQTTPAGINARGIIAGTLLGKEANDGFLRLRDGVIKRFSIPGEALLVQGINDRNEVTGFSSARDSTAGFVYHAFLRLTTGDITLFDFPGGTDTDAISINNAGVITGDYSDGFGVQSFLRVPTSNKLP